MNYKITLLKKQQIWLWTVVNKAIAGMSAIVIGDLRAETFKPLWQIVKGWQCFFM
jgi:IS1 family transposase